MAEHVTTGSAPQKGRRWLRTVAWILGVFLVLLVVVYFVATSSAFVKAVILPKASASLNATITVSDASVSPFSQIILRDLKVQTAGEEPLFTAPEVLLRYSLMDIIRGNILVHEVRVTSPIVTLVQNADGTSNIDPILKSQPQNAAPPVSAPAASPAKIDIQKILLSNGTLRRVKLYAAGKRDLTELSNLNVEVSGLKNGQTGKLTLASEVRLENNPPAPGTNGLLLAKLNGEFNFGLTADLKPGAVEGSTRLEVSRAEGGLAQASGLGLALDTQVTPTDVKRLALVLRREGSNLGQIVVSGPFNLEKTEGRLTVRVLGIDKNLLNIAGASSGLDFGPTAINSTNLLALTSGAQSLSLSGQLIISNFQVTRTNQTTPPMDVRADYDLSLDRAASNVLVRVFNVAGKQRGTEILKGELTSPMVISLDPKATNAVGDSALRLTVTRFDLADWKAFIGDVAPAGEVNAKAQLLSSQAGRQLAFDLDSRINNLTLVADTNKVTGIELTFGARGQAEDLQQFKVTECRFEIARENQPALRVSSSGVYDRGAETADLRLDGEAFLPRLYEVAPQPDASISTGNAKLSTRLLQKQQVRTVTGSLALADLNGRFGSNYFRGFGTTAEFDIGITPQEVQIRRFSGKLAQGTNAGGGFELTGTYGVTNRATTLNAKLLNLNQAGLGTFLEPMLADKKLVSVGLNGTAVAQYEPGGASSLKASLQVTNLIVNDLKGQFPAKPLEASVQVDAALNKHIAEVRQFALGLTPTERATNRVELTGRVDMTQTTNIQGNLKLAADSLDLTSYYDLFAGNTRSRPQTTPTSPTPSPQAPPEAEPEPVTFPLSNFVAEASIGRMFLREIAISNLLMAAKINRGQVALDPCRLDLNGAPVNAAVQLDLGVRGYKYDVSCGAQAIPLAPLVDSFEPERKGQIGGTLTADVKISGAGTTGTDLQKNLGGQFDIVSTNLNLSVIHIRNPLLKSLINVIAMIPELAKNPQAGLTSLVGNLLPQPGAGRTGGLAGELEKSPIDQILLRGSMGGGEIRLQQALVQSPAFEAQANGTVRIEPILTNSQVQIPVSISLSRSIAGRINLVPENTPTNQAYVKLPDFATMRGTLGEPKTDINKVALAGTVFQGVRNLIPGGSGQTGNLIQNLLGGGTARSTNAPAGTNKPATGTTGLLQSILGGTSPPPTNTPSVSATNRPATNQNPIGNLLDGLLGPKKK